MNLKQIKNLPGARKVAMPELVSPQLATLVDRPPVGDEWFHELKFDGYRLLCHLERGQVRLWTRNQKDWTTKFPGVAKAVKALRLKSAILDGEVVALDASGRASFQRLQNSINKGAGAGLLFHVFDLLYIEGYSLTKTPLRERKRVLAELFESIAEGGVLRRFEEIEAPDVSFITCRALDQFMDKVSTLIEWAPKGSTLLLYGGETLRKQLPNAWEILIPNSERRFLFIQTM